MSGDNKLFSAVSNNLFSPAALTKKSPKSIRYDPIAHERIVYSNQTGVFRQVSGNAPIMAPLRSTAQILDSSPFLGLNSSSVTASSEFSQSRGKGPLAQSGYFSLSSSPSLANVKYAKTRPRAECANPITGTKEFPGVPRDALESLGREPRVLANRSRFASSSDLRSAYDLNKGDGDKVAGAKRKVVHSVAYVNLFDLRT